MTSNELFKAIVENFVNESPISTIRRRNEGTSLTLWENKEIIISKPPLTVHY